MRHPINLIDPERATAITEERACSLSDPRAQAFFAANITHWLRRRTDCLMPASPCPQDPPWVFDAHGRGEPIQRFNLSTSAKDELELIGDWLLSVVDEARHSGQRGIEAERILKGLRGTAVADALKKAVTWQWREQKQSAAPPPRGPRGYRTTPLCTIAAEDGFIWEKLPVEDLPYLGFDLLNCLRTGKYQREVGMRTLSVWGLRNPNTHRFVVALSTPGQSHTVLEVRGFRNAHPMAYRHHVQHLMAALGSPSETSPDLRALGL